MPPNINSRPLSRKSEVGFVLKTYWPGILAGVLLVTMVLGYFVVWPLWVARDAREAPARQTIAVVTRIEHRAATQANPVPDLVVTARFNSGEAHFSTQANFEVGQRVRVRYRVGRSGLIYVDSADPLNSATR